MKLIDTFEIPFPKTIEQLTALDSTRDIPFLKAHCNRRHISLPSPNPTAAEIIPHVEQRLTFYKKNGPLSWRQNSGEFAEWKEIIDDLEQFLSQLKGLIPPAPRSQSTPSVSSIKSIPTHLPDSPAAENPYIANPALAFSSLKNEPTLNPRAKSPKNPGHFKKLPNSAPETQAVSANAEPTSKTIGHFNNSSQKNSPTPPLASPISNPLSAADPAQNVQCSMINLQSPITVSQSPAAPKPENSVLRTASPQFSKPRRIHPILSRLTPDQKQQLIHLYEQHEAKDASRIAAEKLNIQISSASLSRLYSTWRIKEDEDTRDDIEAAHNASIKALTENQLQLRLLELASRPNMDHTELRAICHSFARLQSVKLSARRVQLAESKEARLTASNEALKPFSQEEYERGIDVLLGKPREDSDESDESEPSESDDTESVLVDHEFTPQKSKQTFPDLPANTPNVGVQSQDTQQINGETLLNGPAPD